MGQVIASQRLRGALHRWPVRRDRAALRLPGLAPRLARAHRTLRRRYAQDMHDIARQTSRGTARDQLDEPGQCTASLPGLSVCLNR